MREAVIVSTARTGLAKSWRGALNNTHGATMGGHVVRAAIERAGIEPGEVEDVILGCAMPEGATGWDIVGQDEMARFDNGFNELAAYVRMNVTANIVTGRLVGLEVLVVEDQGVVAWTRTTKRRIGSCDR